MELQFKKECIPCLEPALQDVQNIEQTQELRLTDGMPDIGRILSAWGQVILRGKEWLSNSISLSGGMMVWVLYLPEGGGDPQCIDTWVPFQIMWDLPANTPEGSIRTECLTRFVDARSVSARKIMLRCGIAALAEAYVPSDVVTYAPENVPEDVQLLQLTYPVNLPKEAGEKTFLMDEDVSLPASAPKPERLLSYRMTPIVTDQKVMANKTVFRGNGNLHLLYESDDGQLHNWDVELPFSQFAELDQTYSAEAEVDLLLGTTNLELDLDDDGQMHLKCGMVAQYLICDKTLLEVVEDAYSTHRELETEEEDLSVPAILESRRERIYGEQSVAAKANIVVDAQFLPDFPRQKRLEDKIRLELPGTFQMLYYDENGALQSTNTRWEGALDIPSHPDARLCGIPEGIKDVQAIAGSENVILRAEPEIRLTTTSDHGISLVTGLELGKEKETDEERPSLILRRAGDDRLWDMAKSNGSTVDAIKKANQLDAEPVAGQILLIPVS